MPQGIGYDLPNLLNGLLDRLLQEELKDMLDPYSPEVTNAISKILPERSVSNRNPIVRPDALLDMSRDIGILRNPIIRDASNLAGPTAPNRPNAPTLPGFIPPVTPNPVRGGSFNADPLGDFLRQIERGRLAQKSYGVFPF